MSAPATHDPVAVTTADGTSWVRRAVTRDGRGLYAVDGSCKCPEFLMATLAELAEHGIQGMADVLPVPVPVGPEPLSAERLAEITARADAATAGPWCTDAWEIYQGAEYVPGISFWIGETCRGTSELGQDRADAAFVAAARSDVPALVAEVRRQAARIAELEAERHSTNEALDDAVQALRAAQDRITDLEESPLAWAEELDSKSLDNFLIALAAATEYEPLSGAVDEIHQLVRAFRKAAQAQDEREPDVDGAGRTYESYYPERSVKASGDHLYRVSHDLPETGAQEDGPDEDRLLNEDELRRALRGHLFGGGS
ncbi:hypothetical protein OG235_27670 [Streptomyces sp. NBC_00024]|uniref:hypothetical protein n=1 Tax=Streptomyces sp. NBC_00024 TaxID=2903612 RepID=UPI00324B8FBD